MTVRAAGTFDRSANESIADLDALVVDVAKGDRSAFAEIYEAHSSLLFGICRQILKDEREAEDVAHDVFVSLWRAARTYDARKGSALTWLATMARNRAIDRLRELGQVHPDGFVDTLKSTPDSLPIPEDAADRSQEHDRLSECVSELSARDRSLIHTAFFQGQSYSELASRTGNPLGSIKTWIRRALIQLRTCLES